MNLPMLDKVILTTFACLSLSIMAGAQTKSASHEMTPEVKQAIGKMRATQSNDEVLRELKAIEGPAKRATQVILAAMDVLDLAQRNPIIAMLFELPMAEDGLNASHIPILAQLYVKTAQSPPLPFDVQLPRSFIKNATLDFRVLIIVADLLHGDYRSVTRSYDDPMPRLLKLLESARDSNSLSAADRRIVEDAIIVVKKGMADVGPK